MKKLIYINNIILQIMNHKYMKNNVILDIITSTDMVRVV